MKRVVTKIGDVFSVKVDDHKKKYFQLIAFDLTQLNSDVIRAFKTKYQENDNPSLSQIILGEIEFYAHCTTTIGVKLNLWEKVGNEVNVGELKHILFRDTNDYGYKLGEEPIKVSNNWHIWKINDDNFKKVGKLENENQNSFIGLVFNPLGIIELMKGNKYPINYPDFK